MAKSAGLFEADFLTSCSDGTLLAGCGEVPKRDIDLGANDTHDDLEAMVAPRSAAKEDASDECKLKPVAADWSNGPSPLLRFALSPSPGGDSPQDFIGKMLSDDPFLRSPGFDLKGHALDVHGQMAGGVPLDFPSPSVTSKAGVQAGNSAEKADGLLLGVGHMNASNETAFGDLLGGDPKGWGVAASSDSHAPLQGVQTSSLLSGKGSSVVPAALPQACEREPSAAAASSAGAKRCRKRKCCGPSQKVSGDPSTDGRPNNKVPTVSGVAMAAGVTKYNTQSEEELKRIRRVKNRASVEKCRNKQKKRMEALERELSCLQYENRTLDMVTICIAGTFDKISTEVHGITGRQSDWTHLLM